MAIVCAVMGLVTFSLPGMLRAQTIIPATGIMRNLDFYEVNTNGFPVNYPWDADKAMAISSSSNTGLDLFASWFNGSNVVYKHPNPNIMTFRMTKPGVSNLTKSGNIYPNPVVSILNIDGQEGGQYVVADISGRELLRGHIEAHTGIDLHTLSTGIYLLRITTASGKVETLKLLKQ